MRPIPLRKRYFRDVMSLGSLVLGLCLLALTVFNVIEIREHVENREEELEELFVLVGIVLGILPVAAWLAWRTTSRLMRPLRDIEEGVRRIRGGQLEYRLPESGEGDELAYLVESLNAAFDAHREALSRLEAFSGNVAHQLRTPLTALRVAGQHGLSGVATGDMCRETIGRMLEQGERLSRTIDQLLLLATLGAEDSGRTMVPLDPYPLSVQVLRDFLPILEDRGVEHALVAPDVPVRMEGNPVWLREALENLLNNALTHCPDPLWLQLGLSQADGLLRWWVEDNGPGIPEAVRERVFERFRSGGDGGSGLGLAIVAEIAARHGGYAVAMEGRKGGCRIEVRLPVGPAR